MMAGESYAISIPAGTFSDVQGNAYAGLGLTAVQYRISTLPIMQFKESGTVGTTPRYGHSVAVTPDQQIYVAAGRNGTVTAQLAGAPSTSSTTSSRWRPTAA
jgi:hypothetical protein